MNFRLHRFVGPALMTFLVGMLCLGAPVARAQQPPQQGFAVERFYPSAPGGGWFVMDDLDLEGKLAGAIALASGYARNPLVLKSADGTQRLPLVSGEAFVNVGFAVSYDRFRVYLDLPIPVVVNGTGGTLGPYRFNAPSVSTGNNPDTISDTRLGFDIRLLGKPGGSFRLGAGGQVIFPSGERFDYVTDRRYRAMFRVLTAGDIGPYLYAAQLGVHLRPGNTLAVLDIPNGNEFLFGASAGRRFSMGSSWDFIVGPEFYGETAVRSFSSGQTGSEVLLTTRFEGKSDGVHLRVKAGVGHALVQHFGAPEWRVLVSVELIGRVAGRKGIR